MYFDGKIKLIEYSEKRTNQHFLLTILFDAEGDKRTFKNLLRFWRYLDGDFYNVALSSGLDLNFVYGCLTLIDNWEKINMENLLGWQTPVSPSGRTIKYAVDLHFTKENYKFFSLKNKTDNNTIKLCDNEWTKIYVIVPYNMRLFIQL